jgi:hypothetical protein
MSTPDAALGDRHLERAVHQALASLEAEPEAAAVFDRATTAFMRELLGLRGALRAAGCDRQLLAQDDKTLLAELLTKTGKSPGYAGGLKEFDSYGSPPRKLRVVSRQAHNHGESRWTSRRA